MSVESVKRVEALDGVAAARFATVSAIVTVLEDAGIEFTNGGQPGVRMAKAAELWRRVVFGEEDKVAGMTALLQALIPAFEKAGRPSDAKVWHKPTGAGDHIYFFSPAAAAMIPNELERARARPVPLPNLKVAFKQVHLSR